MFVLQLNVPVSEQPRQTNILSGSIAENPVPLVRFRMETWLLRCTKSAFGRLILFTNLAEDMCKTKRTLEVPRHCALAGDTLGERQGKLLISYGVLLSGWV